MSKKEEAVKLARALDNASQAAKQLGIPTSTMHDWIKDNRLRNLCSDDLSDEIIQLRKQLAQKDAELKKTKRENEILKKFEKYCVETQK